VEKYRSDNERYDNAQGFPDQENGPEVDQIKGRRDGYGGKTVQQKTVKDELRVRKAALFEKNIGADRKDHAQGYEEQRSKRLHPLIITQFEPWKI